MFAKLTTVILSFGLTAAVLLVTRQQRIETAHEMSRVHEQILRHERSLWHLRSEMAERCRPGAVRDLLDAEEVEWNPVCDPPEVVPLSNAPAVDAPAEALTRAAEETASY